MSNQHIKKGLELFPLSLGLEIQKYHRLVVEGLINNEANVEIVSSHPSLNLIENLELEFEEESKHFHYIISKKRFLPHIDTARKSYKLTKTLIKMRKPSCVMCDVLNYSVALGAVLAARKMKIKTVGIVTDFPEGSHPKGSIKIPLIWNLIKKCDSYVVLTKYMLDKLNTKKKKCVVIEGQSDIKITHSIQKVNKYNGFTCLYAGSVHERYGIKNLIDGFLKADIQNSRLIVYGSGDYAEQLKAIKDDRIEYRGVASNETVLLEEKRATVLINPRPTDEMYTLYSFPSKTIEYMASGTATVTTRLAGIPDEYRDYLLFFDEFDSNGICNKLLEIASIDRSKLETIGNRAKEFVLKNKNNIVQAKRIMEMVEIL